MTALSAPQMREGVQLEVIGQTLEGRNMDLLQIGGDSPGQPPKPRVWIVARQHPGGLDGV